MPVCRFVPAVVLLLASLGGSVSAQVFTLAGRVVDPLDGLVAGADLSLVAGGSQRVRATRSKADGTFVFDAVAPGEYVLEVSAPGFADARQAITVGRAQADVTVTLEIAAIVEDVTVQGAMMGTAATGKTNLPVRELPLTIQSVGSQVIREQGANDLVAALQNVPGVYAFTNYGVYEGYTFRGFVDLFPSLANQLVDGVRHEGNRINAQLTNIERVDVLKGPSSALYGGGAIGATVNMIRKKPSAQPAYDFSVGAGSWRLARGTFGATGRLASDAVLYRLDVGLEATEGYRHTDPARVQVSPSVAWRMAPSDQINVYYTFNRDRFNGDAGIPMLNTDAGSLLPESAFPDVPRDRNYRTPFDFAESYDHNLQVAYARQLGRSWGFRNTFSYRPVNDDYFLAEYMFVEPPSAVYREYLQFTHFRRPLTNLAELTTQIDGRVGHNIVFGWEGQHYTSRTNTIPGGGVAEAEYIDLYDPVETQQEIPKPLARVAYFTHNTNAFYAQDHLTLGPKVKVMAGGRVDIFRRTSHNNPVTNGVETEGPVLRREADAVTGRLGVVYQPASTVDLYGSVANSFRPPTQAQPDGTTLEPERGRQVEFGQRFHWLRDRLQLNTVLFHIVRENLAFSRPGGFFDQASEVRSRGFEAEVATVPVSNWRINGGYAFTSAEFGDYLVDEDTNLEGNSSVLAPRHIFNVWSAYDWPSGFGLNVGLRLQSSMFVDRDNTFALEGYGVVNLGARYRRGRVEYAVNVNNVTDTEYFAAVLYDSQLYPAEPINVLATVRVRLR
jgi:iron complex outermembrane receptor protein